MLDRIYVINKNGVNYFPVAVEVFVVLLLFVLFFILRQHLTQFKSFLFSFSLSLFLIYYA